MSENQLVHYPPELLNKQHAAYILCTSEWGVSELIRQGKLTPVDDGSKWVKVRLSDIRGYIDALPEKHANA